MMRPTINEESDCLRKKNCGGGNVCFIILVVYSCYTAYMVFL